MKRESKTQFKISAFSAFSLNDPSPKPSHTLKVS